MRRARFILLVWALVSLPVAAAQAAPGTVTVQMPAAAAGAKSLPPLVLAYPLDPDQPAVGASPVSGRVTLRLEAGAWIIATASRKRAGARTVRARLVQVTAGRRSAIRQAQVPGVGPPLSVGRVTFTDRSWSPRLRAETADLVAAELARRAAKAPCAARANPGTLSRNPMWNAIQREAIRVSRSGPSSLRAAAATVASGLKAPGSGASVSGTITSAGGYATGPARGTFRITDSAGNTISERSYSSTTGLRGLIETVMADLVNRGCKERRRIQVDVQFLFQATTSQARGSTWAVLSAVGIEAIAPNGTVERGSYEYEAPVSWTGRADLPATVEATGSCPVSLLDVDFGTPERAPTTLATEVAGAWTLQLAPAVLLGYSTLSPCSGTDSVPMSISIQPALALAVPASGRGVLTGRREFPGVSGSFEVGADVRRLPSKTS